MRNICPKVNSYYGPVYGKEGKQCVTSLDLDEAMLATRDFWFLAPADHDNSWTPVLEVYEQQPSWPVLKPPEPNIPKILLLDRMASRIPHGDCCPV